MCSSKPLFKARRAQNTLTQNTLFTHQRHKTVWALLYFLIYPSTSSFPKPTQELHASVPACVTRSVFLPAQVSSVISISVVMATQQQGGKWQPNLWHSCRPGQAWGQGGIAAMGCKTLLGLPAFNQILLTSEKNKNILIPSATVLVRLMSQIFALTLLFKNGWLK